MASPPYMKLYIADYFGDTHHLDRGEHGAYLLLLMSLWRAGGRLPRDPAKLAKLAKCTPEEWVEIGPVVLAFFTARGGYLTQKRATLEIAKYETIIEGAQTAGNASARKRANKDSDMGGNERSTDVERKSNQPEPELRKKERDPPPPVGSGAEVVDLFGGHGQPERPIPKPDLDQAFDDWNELAKRAGLSIAEDFTEARRRSLGARLKASGLVGWRRALRAVEASAFCRGMIPGRDGRKSFRADLDFVLQAKSFTRLLEGFYGEDAPAASGVEEVVDDDPRWTWEVRLIEFRKLKKWDGRWGPTPAETGCPAPADLLLAGGFGPDQAQA